MEWLNNSYMSFQTYHEVNLLSFPEKAHTMFNGIYYIVNAAVCTLLVQQSAAQVDPALQKYMLQDLISETMPSIDAIHLQLASSSPGLLEIDTTCFQDIAQFVDELNNETTWAWISKHVRQSNDTDFR